MAVETPIQVLLLIYPSFNTLDLNGPLDVLKNPYLSADAFDITIAAASPLTTSYEGVAIHRSISLSQASENLSNYDILIQTGGAKESIAPHLTGSDELILLAQKFSLLGYSPRLGDTRIMMSICTGALFFGYAGVFAGLEATTHIHFLDDLINVCQGYNVRVPGSEVTTVVPSPPDENFRYVKIAGNAGGTARVISSGGISCGLDATLYLVGLLFERKSAVETARIMEYAWREM
jgi:transcriptional regulator GlxA family with amidase domain